MGRERRLETQLAATQQLTHIGSWEWDLETNVVTWSDELYRIYGIEPRSCPITLSAFLAKVHPEDRARIEATVKHAVESGEPFAYGERVFRPDGTMRELDTVGEVERDASGKSVALIGTCRDVTVERRREETILRFADIVKNVHIGLAVWQVDEPVEVSNIRLVAFNPAAERIADLRLGEAIGSSLAEIIPYAAGGELEALLVRVATNGEVAESAVYRSKDPRHPRRALGMKAFPLPGHCVGVAIEDITASTVARAFQDAEQRILVMIASGAPLSDTLASIVLLIDEQAPPTVGSILLLDADGTHLRHGAAPHLPPAFVRAIDGAEIGAAAGSCGTAAYEKRVVAVENIETDPRWAAYDDLRRLAREHGLRGCWSSPICASDARVLGTFALYFRDPRGPTAADLDVVARAAHLAGIAIERKQLEDQMRDLSAHVESVREEERTGIARAIHDELGQALTGFKLDLAWMARNDVPRGDLLEKIRTMSADTDALIDQVRRISAELRPGVLDELGLLAAIEWQAQEFEKRMGIPCTVTSNLGDAQLDRDVTTAAFRIFQESLTNVARHASARHVRVRLERAVASSGGATLELEVRDDGKGIAPDAPRNPRSLGLLGMRERARRLAGAATVTPAEPSGTLVSVTLPLPSRTAS